MGIHHDLPSEEERWEVEVKLYLIEQSVNNDWDTYDSAVVAAEDELAALNTHPNGKSWARWDIGSWCPSDKVTVTYLGEAKEGTKAGVICASFNAG